MKTTRRRFLLIGVSAAPVLALSREALADTPKLSESDPKARAVGYVEDAARVDKAKYPNFAAGQSCGNCSLFQGKSTDAWGGCTLFGDQQVAAKGWCASYTNM
jgi:hypothetical protein